MAAFLRRLASGQRIGANTVKDFLAKVDAWRQAHGRAFAVIVALLAGLIIGAILL